MKRMSPDGEVANPSSIGPSLFQDQTRDLLDKLGSVIFRGDMRKSDTRWSGNQNYVGLNNAPLVFFRQRERRGSSAPRKSGGSQCLHCFTDRFSSASAV